MGIFMEATTTHQRIQQLPQGYSEVAYRGSRYSVVRTDFNQGKSLKVFAQNLGGTDFISFNYYLTAQSQLLKPCEMPTQKVLDFLHGYALIA